LGEHRLVCGDCTDAATVARVMGGERAALVHADPPYGMGKEKDGIANDNLYREKLDTFQMAWWRACRSMLDDNGSVYIWGNADDLWRLWYCGGLRDSERLTMRNEIVWQKQGAQGIRSETHRQYPTASERCLFFMLGEQGFNNNADNWWDGWEPIRGYLDGERIKMGWSKPQVETILGSINKTQHTFSQSHFNLIQEVDYLKLQTVANGRAFQRDYDELKRDYDELKRDYDELKRDFYITRAYFDNTHDNMTDVWQFGRVTGDDRHDHATPKPTDMIARVVKSSAPDGAIVYVPFGGTLPEVIACENLGRKCRACEISPAYVAVALERWAMSTGKTPVLVGGDDAK
jgi:DNA modification methylase